MTKSWSVPFPESETEHDGMPVFWRFQATVEEDGIKIFALQYIAFHQTEHYAWLVPLNRPGFPGEYFICELRLPDH
uniref:hypothetical protein n=1 Tax=Escherichia coli TaxID=562 RepID=UPI0030C70D0D